MRISKGKNKRTNKQTGKYKEYNCILFVTPFFFYIIKIQINQVKETSIYKHVVL